MLQRTGDDDRWRSGRDVWAGPGPERTQLELLAGMLARRWASLVIFGAIGAALALGLGLLVPRQYTAKAQIAIETPATGVDGAGASAAVNESDIETHVTIIASRAHLETVHRALSNQIAEPSGNAASEDESEVPSVDELELKVKVFQERNSRVIAVAFRARRPAIASAVANAIASLYVQRLAEHRGAVHAGAMAEPQLTSLNHKLHLARTELARRQARLATLRRLHADQIGSREFSEALDSAVGDLPLGDTAQIRSQLQLATALTGSQPSDDGAADVLKNVRTRLALELDRLRARAEAETEVTAGQVRALEQQAATLTAARDAMREARALEGTPAHEAIPATFEELLRRQKQEVLRFDAPGGLRVLSLADAPQDPSSADPILFVMPGMIAFIVFGGMLGHVREQLDRSIHHAGDVRSALAIPCLGLVPRLSRQDRRRLANGTVGGSSETYTEAIRSIFLATAMGAPPNGPPVVLVTSSLSGEGRTTLAVSLAAYAAGLKKRVVLLDLSFRHPGLVEMLGEGSGPDVLDVLAGAPLADAISRVEPLGLDLLPMRQGGRDPLAHLTGDRLPVMLDRLRERYDLVVIDGGPLLGASEARLIAPSADKVLLAIRWGVTKREFVQYALGWLCGGRPSRPEAAAIGAVITRVNVRKHARYRYGDVPA